MTASVYVAPTRSRLAPGMRRRLEPMAKSRGIGIKEGNTQIGAGKKKVFICSPYRPAGETEHEREKSLDMNLHLARYACRYAAEKGCFPIAPHLYFPQFLDDKVADEREFGIALGILALSECDEIWIVGRRISEGMRQEINKAQSWGIPAKYYIPRFTEEERILKLVFDDAFPFHEMV